jgi:hypothetical protein
MEIPRISASLAPSQRVVLAVCFIAILVRGMYPPWIEKIYWSHGRVTEERIDRGGSILTPPYRSIAYAQGSEITVDVPTLAVHWFLVVTIAAALTWALQGRAVSAGTALGVLLLVNVLLTGMMVIEVRKTGQTAERHLRSIRSDLSSIESDVSSIRSDVSSLESNQSLR